MVNQMKISKLDAALRQLDVAIRLFFEGDYVSSLTLAGAAEEILGKLSERAGLSVSIDILTNHHRKDTDPALSNEKSKEVISGVANRGRNQAKHANDPNEMYCDNEKIWPLQMLMRAIPMANNLGNLTVDMQKMIDWINSHPEETR
jgi:hypothetical protein